jgi:hypothetical protein
MEVLVQSLRQINTDRVEELTYKFGVFLIHLVISTFVKAIMIGFGIVLFLLWTTGATLDLIGAFLTNLP